MGGKFSSVPTPRLIEQITTLAGHFNAANARFLALVAELAEALDQNVAISALMERRAKNVPAGTSL